MPAAAAASSPDGALGPFIIWSGSNSFPSTLPFCRAIPLAASVMALTSLSAAGKASREESSRRSRILLTLSLISRSSDLTSWVAIQ